MQLQTVGVWIHEFTGEKLSKPKKSQYQASEADKQNQEISMAQKNFYRQNYLPKLKERMQAAFDQEEGVVSMAQGRAQADTMQALSNPNREAVMSVDRQADLASAASAQQLQGIKQGMVGARSDQVGVLKQANQMQSTTMSGLAQAAKIATTDTLQRAQAKQTQSLGIIKGLTNLGKGAAYSAGFEKGQNPSPTQIPDDNNPQGVQNNQPTSILDT